MKSMFTILVIAAVMLSALPNAAVSAVIVSWENDDADGLSSTPADVVHADVSSSSLALGAGLTVTTWNDSLAAFANDLSGTLAGAITANDYFTFTVTPDGGKQVDYSSLFFRASVNFTVDIEFTLMSSLTGGFVNGNEIESFTASNPSSGAGTYTHTYTLSGEGNLQDASSAVEYRVYAHATSGAGNRMGIGQIFSANGTDDLVVSGTTESSGGGGPGGAVPEPSSLGLIVVGALGTGLLRRKGKKRQDA